MRRFFFHLVWPQGREDDLLGSEFEGLEEAYLDASKAALDMTVELASGGRDPLSHTFEICDGDGLVLLELRFAEVLRTPLPRPLAPADLSRRLQRALELQQDHARLNVAVKSGVAQALETVRAIRSTLKDF